jgi:hypothetical protein
MAMIVLIIWIMDSGRKMKKVEISERHLLDLIFYARRYCDGRSTYATYEFNRLYIDIRSDHPDTMRKDIFDSTLKDKGAYWPYAKDGMFAIEGIEDLSLPNSTNEEI